MVTTKAMIIIAACGVGLAVLYTYFIKKVLGGFIRRLEEKEASSIENALTLAELGYSGFSARVIYAFLGESSSLRRFVGAPELVRESIEEQKYYLLPEKKDLALKRYSDKGLNLRALILSAVALIIAAIIFILAAPFVEGFIDGIPARFGKDDDTEIQGTVDDGIEMITPEEIEKRYEEELKKQQEEAEKNKQLEEAMRSDEDSSEKSSETDEK